MSFACLMHVLSLFYFALQTQIHLFSGAMGTSRGFYQDSSLGLMEAQSSGSSLCKPFDSSMYTIKFGPVLFLQAFLP
jgi:hypothetical protein